MECPNKDPKLASRTTLPSLDSLSKLLLPILVRLLASCEALRFPNELLNIKLLVSFGLLLLIIEFCLSSDISSCNRLIFAFLFSTCIRMSWSWHERSYISMVFWRASLVEVMVRSRCQACRRRRFWEPLEIVWMVRRRLWSLEV